MKWVNKGHELDEYAKSLMKIFESKKNSIYIFGAGLLGREIKDVIKKIGCFSGFIDNDIEKQKLGVTGEKVISLQKFIEDGAKGLVVIAASPKNILIIKNQLCEIGLNEERDFYIFNKFMERVLPVWLFYEKKKLYVDLVQICLTERCNLRCKKCAHGCYAVGIDSNDLDFETVKKSADVLFEKVDFVREFVLIGGEPFLYKELTEVIEYIGERYRDRISIFSITTNGSILPCQNVLDMCRKYNILIRISNYSMSIKYLKGKYEQLQRKLGMNYISFILGDKEQQWMDYGFETVDRKWEKDELISVFDKCSTPCREIRGTRYYYCVMARSVSENLGVRVGEDDYLDLSKLGKEDRTALLEFQMGYSEKGYLDMCNYCNGAEASNNLIPAAEQI